MELVVTYQHAFMPGTTDLCARHARTPYPGTPALGAVVEASHEGECDSCGIEAMLSLAESPRHFHGR
jgi:hypothetical protein